MQFLTSLFGESLNAIILGALALGIVIVLIVLVVWGLKAMFKVSGNVARGRNRRLSVVDSMAIDPKRQLLIIRRDNVEHLILTGGAQDVVVETGIPVQAQPVRPIQRRPVPPMPELDRPASSRRAEIEPAPIPAPEPRSTIERLRELGRPATQRSPTSLRHTGLMRPVSRTEPSIVPLDNSDYPRADSATQGQRPAGTKGSGPRAGDDGTFSARGPNRASDGS